MPKKYHINTRPAPLGWDYIYKFRITRGAACINCGKCTRVCIYEAHKRRADDPRQMAPPNTVVCRNCFRCIQECPRGALEKSINPEFAATGGEYWKPDLLLSLFKQATDGKVPVSGAGYRGPFSGEGFDGMWTDMSEIVRPTRDGIHGREYISTAVEVGRKLSHLTFDKEGELASAPPPTVDLPLPLLFDLPPVELPGKVREAMLAAAAEVGTCLLLPAASITPEMEPHLGNIVPVLAPDEVDKYAALLARVRLVALEYSETLEQDFPALQQRIKALGRAVTIVRVPANRNAEDAVARLAARGAEAIQLVADYRGQDSEGGRLLKDTIRAVHQRLVAEKVRSEVTLIASGGIALAEHLAKAMLCGADLTAVDIPLLVALGARLYEEPERLTIPPELAQVPPPVLTQRLVNLMGAWHLQLLEMMGAMGIREARRLRGESGRAIFFEDIERETFGRLFQREGANR